MEDRGGWSLDRPNQRVRPSSQSAQNISAGSCYLPSAACLEKSPGISLEGLVLRLGVGQVLLEEGQLTLEARVLLLAGGELVPSKCM